MTINHDNIIPSEFQELPLCVDLDGTLINTDLLMESLFSLLRYQPWMIFIIPIWLLKGRAFLKEQLVRRVNIDAATLPYHNEFLSYLHQLYAHGRYLVLATASHEKFAKEVARHLGIFHAVLATENNQNLSRSRKGRCLVNAYGERGFDYAGNSRADLAVWLHARNAILVNAVPGIKHKTQKLSKIINIFDDRHHAWKAYLQFLHLERWIKNLLIFIPLIITGSYSNSILLIHSIHSFISFSLCASSVYILSNLLNLTTDRCILHKRNDPLVSGKVSIIHGVVLVPLLLIMAIIIALPLSIKYLLILAIYYVVSIIYYVYYQNKLISLGLYITRLLSGWIII